MSGVTGAAARLASALERRQRPSAAMAVLRAAARLPGSGAPALRALCAETELRQGKVPTGLVPLRQELAAAADAVLDRGGSPTALLTRLAAVSFHRVEHLDGPSSPLAEDPTAFLAPLRSSRAWQRLTAPRPGATARPRAAGPLRVSVVVDADRRFLDPLLAHLGDEVEVDVVDLSRWGGPPLPRTPGEQIAARWDPTEPWADALTARLAAADVIWVEWCQRGAVLIAALPLHQPLVVRLHSFEAFTVFPHLVDPARVAALLTVSPAFAGLVSALVPALGPVTQVLPNALDPAPFRRPKAAGADRVVGLLGWGAPAKDAGWALEVLVALRREDPQWRMHLVGPPPDRLTAGSRDYDDLVRRRLAQPDLEGAVTLVGEVSDMPEALRDIGAVVSSSTRESFHLAVAEAAASGAVVAVRDWPTLAPYGGPRGVWPDSCIVQTPQQAADLISSGASTIALAPLSPETAGEEVRALLDQVASLAERHHPGQ